ncbi:MAG: primase-helicase family protein [Litoreibacter sp.]
MTTNGKLTTGGQYLSELHPNHGVAISTHNETQKGFPTKFFPSLDVKGMDGYIAESVSAKNVYYSVNKAPVNYNNKAHEQSILGVQFLHVDVDPHDHLEMIEDDTERNEALNKWKDETFDALINPIGLPEPTYVVFSGNGYQALWRLKDVAEGDDRWLAKDYNRMIEKRFEYYGADNCHNIDRVLRVPFTKNFPNEKKRTQMHRTVQVSKLVCYNPENVYSLSDFPTPDRTEASQSGDERVKRHKFIDVGEIVYTEDLSDLRVKYNLADSALLVVSQGIPDEKKQQGIADRSAQLWHAVCELAREDVEPEVMMGLLLDRGWGISDHVYDQKKPEQYALRQVKRAYKEKENPTHPMMVEMNVKHVQLLGVEAGIGTIVPNSDDPTQTRLIVQPEARFKARYPRKTVEWGTDKDGKATFITPAEFWLHEKNAHCRRIAEDRVMETSSTEKIVDWGGVPFWNEYQGWGVTPKAGDIPAIMEHIHVNMANSSDEINEYILNLLAWWCQNPGEVAEVAGVFLGPRGTGKSMFWENFAEIWGPHGLVVSGNKHLVGQFTGQLENKLFVFVDEGVKVSGREGSQEHSQLKTVLTSKTRMLEKKGVDARQVRNQIKAVMVSNDKAPIPAGMDERRFFIQDMGIKHQQDREFFGKVWKEFREHGKEALLHMLLDRPLGDFHPAASIPNTKALKRNKWADLPDELQVLVDMADTAILPGPKPNGRGWKQAMRNRTAILYDFEREHDRGSNRVTGLQTVLRNRYPRLKLWGDRQLTQFFTSNYGFTRGKTTEGSYVAAPDLGTLRGQLEDELGTAFEGWSIRTDDWQSECEAQPSGPQNDDDYPF